jgi:hypothetical protein
VTAFVVATLAMPAHAQIYRWTDDKGQVHITNDPNQVPERYRRGGATPEQPMPRRPSPSESPGERTGKLSRSAAYDAIFTLRAAAANAPATFHAFTADLQTVQRHADTAQPFLAVAERLFVGGALLCYRGIAESWQRERESAITDPRWRTLASVDESYGRRVHQDCSTAAEAALRALSE